MKKLLRVLTTAVIGGCLAATAHGDEIGVPTVGAVGITLTVDQINLLDRQKGVPDAATAPRRPRLRAPREGLAQDPLSPRAPPVARAPQASSVGVNAVTLATNFTGATAADSSGFPPDTMGAVGPSQFIVAINGRIRTFNKTTGVADGALNATMDTFFASVTTPLGGGVTSNFTSDPHIRYDRLSGRWIMVIIDVPNGGVLPNRVLFAVSSGATITGAASFTFFQFRHDALTPAGDTNNFADYPTLGIDANALYVGANIFTAAGGFAGTSAYVIRKSSILGAGPMVATAFRNLTGTPGGAGIYTPQGVDNFEAVPAEGYFIGTDNAAFGRLVLRRVSNAATTPALSANISVTVAATQFPITVPHLGNTGGANGNLDGSDDRLYAAHLRNGRLWTAHASQVNSAGAASTVGGRNGSRWYELQGLTTATPTVVQSGTVFDSAAANPLSFWMPTITVSGQGHVVMGFSSAGAASSINAAVTQRWSGDAASTLQPVVNYTASSTAYNPPGDAGSAGGRRWGDYSNTSLDPEDDMTLWTIQEFCDATNSWAVRVAKIVAPPPPPTLSAVPNSMATGLPSVNVVITGSGITAALAQGFYDPGTGFAKRLAATIPGVIVNSVLFTSAASITLNLSTVGATAGSKNATVTNPDGQAVTAIALITLSASAAAAITSGSSTTFTTGALGSFTVTSTGTPTPTITRTGAALASGVTFVDNGNGTATLSGTPAAGTGGAYASTIIAANGVLPNATQSFTLTVNQAPAFTSATPPGGTVGTAYAHNYAASGFPIAMSFSLASGALPPSFTLSAAGALTGTTATAGTYTGTVAASNGVLPTASQSFSIVINKQTQSISFAPITAFSWYQGSASVAASASSSLAVAYSVLSGPCSLSGTTVTASGPGSCVLAANQAGNATFNPAAQQTQAVTVNVGPMLLDIDGSNSLTRYDPATDGVMLLRYLLGFVGPDISNGVIGGTATRNAAQIQAHLVSIRPLLDVDGDGFALPSTDGVLIVRYLLGLRGAPLLQGATAGPNNALQIEAAISRLRP